MNDATSSFRGLSYYNYVEYFNDQIIAVSKVHESRKSPAFFYIHLRGSLDSYETRLYGIGTLGKLIIAIGTLDLSVLKIFFQTMLSS